MAKNRKLNVGLVFDDSLDRPDGVAQYVKTVGTWLYEQGHEVSYLVGQTSLEEWHGGKVYSLSKNYPVSFNGNKLSIPLPGSKRRIKKFISGQHFDVLHVMVPYSPFMAANVVKYATKETAVVGTFHIFPSGAASKIGSRFLRLMLLRSLKKFDRIVSVSPAASGFALSHYGIESSVIPNAVDIDKFKTKGTKNNPGSIVFLGRLVRRKGAAQLINAFAKLKKMNSSAKLIIAGDGPLKDELITKVDHLGLTQDIKFLGYIDESDKPELLASATIACFPSLSGEAFGIVLIEAMAAGAGAVVGGNNPGYSSVLGEQPELLINPNDRMEFADRLHRLLSYKNKLREITAWQSKEVQRYDVKVVGEQLIDMYTDEIARLNKKRHNKAHG